MSLCCRSRQMATAMRFRCSAGSSKCEPGKVYIVSERVSVCSLERMESTRAPASHGTGWMISSAGICAGRTIHVHTGRVISMDATPTPSRCWTCMVPGSTCRTTATGSGARACRSAGSLTTTATGAEAGVVRWCGYRMSRGAGCRITTVAGLTARSMAGSGFQDRSTLRRGCIGPTVPRGSVGCLVVTTTITAHTGDSSMIRAGRSGWESDSVSGARSMFRTATSTTGSSWVRTTSCRPVSTGPR